MSEPAEVVDMATGEILERPLAETAPERAQPQLTFEGHPVDALSLKVAGTVYIDIDTTVSVDDRLRIVGEFKVSGVRHYVDPKSGLLIREHVIRPIEHTLGTVPWDPEDPQDDGIVRAIR